MTCRANGAAVRSWRRVGNNSIRVRLSGGNGAQDLQLVISGHGLNPFTLASDSRAAGTYTYRFPFEDIPEGHYDRLTARWPRSPIVAEANLSLTAPICAGGLSDVRSAILREYWEFDVVSRPRCADFANAGGSAHFSWDELNGGFQGGNPHRPWGIVNVALTAGLEQTRTNYGRGELRLTSGYRCPHGNHNVGGVAQSNHMQGRAVDVYSADHPWTREEFGRLKDAALRAGATEALDWDEYPRDRHLQLAWE